MKQLDFFLEPSSDYYNIGARYENPLRNSGLASWRVYSKSLKGINAKDRIQVFLKDSKDDCGTNNADAWNWGLGIISHFKIISRVESVTV